MAGNADLKVQWNIRIDNVILVSGHWIGGLIIDLKLVKVGIFKKIII